MRNHQKIIQTYFLLKGNNALGTEFYTPFQNLLNSQFSQSKAGIDIVATEDNTIVEIIPTQNLIGFSANTTISINLNKVDKLIHYVQLVLFLSAT